MTIAEQLIEDLIESSVDLVPMSIGNPKDGDLVVEIAELLGSRKILAYDFSEQKGFGNYLDNGRVVKTLRVLGEYDDMEEWFVMVRGNLKYAVPQEGVIMAFFRASDKSKFLKLHKNYFLSRKK